MKNRQGVEMAGNLLPENGVVKYYRAFFPEPECGNIFSALLAETGWRQEPVKIFGKELMQPRLTAWCADEGVDYSYSGITLQGKGWTKTVLEIKKSTELFLNTNFNSVLLNLYRNGEDSMGWHRDNEKELGAEPYIASLSFGATRKFKLRDYKQKTPSLELKLEPGSLLVMSGRCQEYWEHCLPKTVKIKEARINLTFRSIIANRKII